MKIHHKSGQKKIAVNRRKAIRERCLNCSSWYRKDVDDCYMTDCHLHPYRTGKGKQNAKKRAVAIRLYCFWCCAEQRAEVLKCPAKDCPLFPYRKSIIDKSVKI
jgi:hypothetical protein